MMNWTASVTIAVAIEVLTFFLFFRRTPQFFGIRILIIIIIIVSDSGDKSDVTYNWGTQKSRFEKRGPQSKMFRKPWFKSSNRSI